MLAIKFLTGELAGKCYPLGSKPIRLGRSETVDIQIPVKSISKEHAELLVSENKVLIKDLRSANGTFLNGTRVQGAVARLGDKISFHDVLVEIVILADDEVGLLPSPQSRGQVSRALTRSSGLPAVSSKSPALTSNSLGNVLAPSYEHNVVSDATSAQNPPPSLEKRVDSIVEQTKRFIDEVAMPGVFRLPEVFEFKWVLWSLLATFVVLVTLLTIIPMKVITNETTRSEAFRRSLGIARSLAQTNERAVRSEDLQRYTVTGLLKEEGLIEAYIISREGQILAPPERVGMPPKQVDFARRIRAQPREFVESTSDGMLIAAAPILVFDPEIQQNSALAHAVVVYDPASLAFGDERVLSLFIQMLTIALALGSLLFFILYKLLEYPLKSLNHSLDRALRQENIEIKMDFKFPVIQELVFNLNSLINRAYSPQPQQSRAQQNPIVRQQEVSSLMDLMGYPCLLIGLDLKIIRPNLLFETLTGLSLGQVTKQGLDVIPDQAMQQNFENLIREAKESADQKSQDSLDLSGHQFRLNCQVLQNSEGDPEFYLIVITPDQGQGVAA